MAEFNSSKNTLNGALSNLRQGEIKEIENNNSLVLDISKKVENIIQPSQEDEEESESQAISNSVQTMTAQQGKISTIISKISTHINEIHKTATEVSVNVSAINSLLASNLVSLMQINSVLSAFRADFIVMSNGGTINGESYINKQLIQQTSALIKSQDKNVRQLIGEMRKAGKYADLMSNAVRKRIGNTKMAKEGEDQGLFSKLLGKLSPDMAEIGGAFAPFLQAFGIDDTNIKTTLSSILGKEKTKTVIDPLNELIGSLMNSPDTGKGINAKKMFANWFNEKTGFGDDTKELKKEKNPKLVMSALAPFADDIKQIVEAKYEALAETPQALKRIAPYAKPVWVVNSEYQKNGLKFLDGFDEEETLRFELLNEKLDDLIKGNATNKRDKNGKELYKDNGDGTFEGSLIDQYLSQNKQMKNASFNDQMMHLTNKKQEQLQKKHSTMSNIRLQGFNNATGKYEEQIVDRSNISNIMNADTSSLDNTLGRVVNPISMIPEVISGNGRGIIGDISGSIGEIKDLIHSAFPTHHGGKKSKSGNSSEIAILAKGEEVLTEEELAEKEDKKEKVSMLGLVSGTLRLATGSFKTLSVNLIKFLNKEKIDPKDGKIPKISKDNPFKDSETKGTESGQLVSKYLSTINESLGKLTSGITVESERKKGKERKTFGEDWDKENEKNNKKESPMRKLLKKLGIIDEDENNEDENNKDENSEEDSKDNKDKNETETSSAEPSQDENNNEKENTNDSKDNKDKNETETSSAEPSQDENKDKTSSAEPSEEVLQAEQEQQALNQQQAQQIQQENEQSRAETEAKAANDREKANQEYLAAEEQKRNAEKSAQEQGDAEREKIKDQHVKDLINVDKEASKDIKDIKEKGAKEEKNKSLKRLVKEKAIKLKQWVKEKGKKLKEVIAEKGKLILNTTKRLASKLGKVILRLGKKILRKGKNIIKKIAGSKIGLAIKSAASIGKSILGVIGKGIQAASAALSGAVLTLPVSPVPVIAGAVGIAATVAGVLAAIKKGKKPKDNSDGILKNVDKQSEKEKKKAEKEKEKEEKEKNKEASQASPSEKTDKNKTTLNEAIAFIKNKAKEKKVKFEGLKDSIFSFMNEKMFKSVEKNLDSDTNRRMLKDPEKMSNMLFSINGGSSALGLSNASNNEIKNLKNASDVSSAGLSGIVSAVSNTATNNNFRSSDIGDKNNNYSENAEIAYGQYKTSKSINNFLNKMAKSLGQDVIEDENGNALSTSEIIKKEQMANLTGSSTNNGVNTTPTTINGSTNTSSSTNSNQNNNSTNNNQNNSSNSNSKNTTPTTINGSVNTSKPTTINGSVNTSNIKLTTGNRSTPVKPTTINGSRNSSKIKLTKVNGSYNGRGKTGRGNSNLLNNEFISASNYALQKGFKETNGGTYPSFFKNYLGKSGIDVNQTNSIDYIKKSLISGNPVILMGRDENEDGTTPFGSEPHYVVATGYDGKNIIVEDSESPTGNDVYNANKTLNKSSIKLSTSTGRGNNSIKTNINPTKPKKLNIDRSNLSKNKSYKNKKKYFGGRKTKYGKGFDKWIFCGDSRTVGLGNAIGNIETIAEVGQGYNYFSSIVDSITSKVGYNIVLWFGVNDTDNFKQYAIAYNSLKNVLKGKSNIIVCTVGPCQDKYHDDKLHGGAGQSVEEYNKNIRIFNKKLLEDLDSDIQVIDIFTLLQNMINSGKDITTDCLHYNNDTYKEVYKAMTSGATISPTSVSSSLNETSTNLSNANLTNLGTVSLSLDSYVDGSVLEKYLKSKSNSDNTNTSNKSNKKATSSNGSSTSSNKNGSSATPSEQSILNKTMQDIQKEINNTNTNNKTNSVITTDYNEVYKKNGTTYIKNNSDFVDKTKIKEILEYFKELNGIQDDSLEVIEIIYEKLRKQKNKSKKLINGNSVNITGIKGREYSF